jgi:hypothetical protein
METNAQRHQIELKERDLQLDQLRRQLKYAVTEEEETLKELKTATNEHAAEKLQLEKKVVELEAQLALVEGKLNEWKEKALETTSQLRSQTRQSAMKVGRLKKPAGLSCAGVVADLCSVSLDSAPSGRAGSCSRLVVDFLSGSCYSRLHSFPACRVFIVVTILRARTTSLNHRFACSNPS